MFTKLRLAVVGTAAMLALAPAPAKAEPSAKGLLALIAKGGQYEMTGTYVLQAYYDGYLWANAYVENKTNKKGHIYCPPRNMIMQADQTHSILVEYIKAHPDKADLPAGMVVLLALQETFACDE